MHELKWAEMSLNKLKRACMSLNQSKWIQMNLMHLNERGTPVSKGQKPPAPKL